LKRLDFNKDLTVLGYLGVENNENESWVDMSRQGLKCLWVEVSMG